MSRLDDEMAAIEAFHKSERRRRLYAWLGVIAVAGFCVAIVLAITSCTPQPGPVPMPPVDASDAAPATCPQGASDVCCAACAQLAAIGCSDGRSLQCPIGLTHIDQSGSIATPCGSALCPPITCAPLSTARTIAEARARGAGCL